MKLIGYIFLVLTHGVFSQVLDNREGNAFTDKPFFNEQFVQKNKLKRLSGFYVYKKKGETMQSTKYKYVYDFDRQGHLISSFETCPDDGTKDTIWNIYKYDERSRLIEHKKTDLEGFQVVSYNHDSLNRVVSEEFMREIYDEESETSRLLSFNKERLVYANYGDQTKRTRFNNYELPYLDEFFNYNDLGYLVERIERVKMTSDVYTYFYEYNEKGKLSAIRKLGNKTDNYMEELTFKYDNLGNLSEKHIYKNGVFTTDIQIIYNSKSKLVSSIITRQVSTGFLMILRFKDFEFFN